MNEEYQQMQKWFEEAMASAVAVSLEVEYYRGMGNDAHLCAGQYRVNPVTGAHSFSAWHGLGRFDTSKRWKRVELVCKNCGTALSPGDIRGFTPLCYSDENGTMINHDGKSTGLQCWG